MGGKNNAWTYGKARDTGVAALQEVFASAGCSKECVAAQVDAYHRSMGVQGDSTPLRADWAPLTEQQEKFGASVLRRAASSRDL
jgi:hypothetical protein